MTKRTRTIYGDPNLPTNVQKKWIAEDAICNLDGSYDTNKKDAKDSYGDPNPPKYKVTVSVERVK